MPLTSSERINLIRQCVGRLMSEDWPIIDLTLNGFGLPTEEVWNNGKDNYLITMLRGASDPVLIDLAQHVGVEFAETESGVDPPFWRHGMLRVFISHLASHRGYTAMLQSALLDFGISGFVAHNDIEPTSEWMGEIETALATCDGLIALLHPEFHVSNWTDQEIGYVMGRGLPVFTIRYGQDPYGFMGRFQAFNGQEKNANVLATEIFHGFRRNKQTSAKFSEVLVSLFEQSGSFAAARTRLEYLEELEAWSPSFNPRILAAKDGNSQIKESWGVPERVDALVEKWK